MAVYSIAADLWRSIHFRPGLLKRVAARCFCCCAICLNRVGLELFVRNFHNTIGLDPGDQFNDQNPQARKKEYPDAMDWRHIAWRVLVNSVTCCAARFWRCL